MYYVLDLVDIRYQHTCSCQRAKRIASVMSHNCGHRTCLNERLNSISRQRGVRRTPLLNKSSIDWESMEPVRRILQQVLTSKEESIHKGREKGEVLNSYRAPGHSQARKLH